MAEIVPTLLVVVRREGPRETVGEEIIPTLTL